MAHKILALDISAHAVRGAAIESSFRDYKVTGLYEEDAATGQSLSDCLRGFIEKHICTPTPSS